MTRVLFVCMGNICRSPTAHGIFREQVRQAGLQAEIIIDSAGTHAYHIGEPPDRRSIETAHRYGIDISDLRARQVSAADFVSFDYIFAMDRDNLERLQMQCPRNDQHKLSLMRELVGEELDVPDPYYGGDSGFDEVFQMLTAASSALLASLLSDTHEDPAP